MECRTKKTPLAWLRAGLKSDYRPKGLSKEERARDRELEKQERARDAGLKRRKHDGTDVEMFGDLLKRLEVGREPAGNDTAAAAA